MSPSSNRTCGFPTSGSPEDCHQAPAVRASHPAKLVAQSRECRRQRRVFRCRSSSVCCGPSGSPFVLTQCTSSVPPLRSTPITELLRYYGRLRFPSRASDWVMSSPAPLRRPRHRSDATAPARASQVPRLISRRALSPYTPESLVVATPVAGRPVAGFSSSGSLATLTCLSRPNSGFTGVTARVVTAPGFASRITPTYAGLATC